MEKNQRIGFASHHKSRWHYKPSAWCRIRSQNYLVSEKGEIGIDTINSIFACLDPSEIMNSGKLTQK